MFRIKNEKETDNIKPSQTFKNSRSSTSPLVESNKESIIYLTYL